MQDFSSSHVKQIWCILSRNKKSKNTNITTHVSSYAKEDEHLQHVRDDMLLMFFFLQNAKLCG